MFLQIWISLWSADHRKDTNQAHRKATKHFSVEPKPSIRG
jgi:hypothetical protein